MRYVTLKDVAKVANVSYATVSRALSGSTQISEKTRKRILKICHEMGYMADVVARSMVMRSTRTIGLIVTDVNNPFMSEIASYIEQCVRANGYDLMLCSSLYNMEQEDRAFQLLLSRRVDGVVIVPSGHGSVNNLQKYTVQVPTIFISENSKGLPVHYVSVDNYVGSVIGTEYLVSLGHRKIIYFGRREESSSHHLRAKGYNDVCENHGLLPTFVDNPNAISSIQNGYQLAKHLFADSGSDFTAIFASSDTNALGVIKAADEAGIEIPKHVSLLGFDDISYADLPKINLSTIAQPKKELANSAVNALVKMINQKNEDSLNSNELFQEVMLPKLVIRKSCIQIGLEK